MLRWLPLTGAGAAAVGKTSQDAAVAPRYYALVLNVAAEEYVEDKSDHRHDEEHRDPRERFHGVAVFADHHGDYAKYGQRVDCGDTPPQPSESYVLSKPVQGGLWSFKEFREFREFREEGLYGWF